MRRRAIVVASSERFVRDRLEPPLFWVKAKFAPLVTRHFSRAESVSDPIYSLQRGEINDIHYYGHMIL